ncbi:MAG: hypothetical protein EOO13_09275 [Chitinophagaceae bacterium]|nr:MAG: hypothetical protein EOO13_09275 [Chitinophagaceae bacterium]
MKFIFASILCGLSLIGQAQDSTLLEEIKDQDSLPDKVYGIFKSTRVINAHSVDMLRKGNLDFRILHRFGFVNNGLKEMFGLDEAAMRIGLDYGVSDNFTIGFGRSTLRKEIDLFGKWRLMQQSTGLKANPFSLVMAAGWLAWTEESFAVTKPSTVDRFSYYLQLLAGKKFSPKFSGQLSPVFVRTNTPLGGGERNLFAAGAGIRFKISKRAALTLDYHPVLSGLAKENTNPLSLGIDIETGGHVFQLHLSNATGMNERAYISETYGDFFKGDIRMGFNLSRMFQIGKRNK